MKIKGFLKILGIIAFFTLIAFFITGCPEDKTPEKEETPEVTNPVTIIMRNYISDVVGHFKGRIYSWDVLNEAFPDGVSAGADWKTSMRTNNPWYKAIGSNFVYEGFLAARLADPDAILYYNDYNLDNSGKATMVRNMVRDVNNKYLASDDKPDGESAGRLLIEGIGMQSHHNTNVQANSIRATLNLFKPLGVKISISELDVLAQGYKSALEGANKSPDPGNNLTLQATRYGEYRAVFIDFSDIIERVTLWGVTDDKSWRSAGQPLLFDSSGKAKEAYYSFTGTTGSGEDIMNLTPMKTQFSANFMMGNIFNPSDVSGSSSVTNTRLTRHFDILTAENNMKPSYIAPSRNNSTGEITYSWTTADNMVNAARASGFKVVGHTLLWHSQNAGWMNNL